MVNGTNASYAHDIESMVSSLTHTEPTS
jgi:hypothetical protein